jgi:hypothetical protein
MRLKERVQTFLEKQKNVLSEDIRRAMQQVPADAVLEVSLKTLKSAIAIHGKNKLNGYILKNLPKAPDNKLIFNNNPEYDWETDFNKVTPNRYEFKINLSKADESVDPIEVKGETMWKVRADLKVVEWKVQFDQATEANDERMNKGEETPLKDIAKGIFNSFAESINNAIEWHERNQR